MLDKYKSLYIPIFSIFVYFGGFYYITEYFQWLGLTGAYRDLTAFQVGQFAFVVVYHVLYFTLPMASQIFIGGLLGAGLLIIVPNFHVRLPEGAGAYLGCQSVPLFPSFLRHLAAALLAFFCIFNASERLGIHKACERLQNGDDVVTLVGLKKKNMTPSQLLQFNRLHDGVWDAEAKEYTVHPEMRQIWRTEKTIFLAQGIRNCVDQNRLLMEIPVTAFDYAVIVQRPYGEQAKLLAEQRRGKQ